MEGHMCVLDMRLKRMDTALEQRFAILNENLFGIQAKPPAETEKAARKK
jgi:hypothetical protein